MSPIPTVYSGACPQLATKIGDHLKYQETYLVAQRIKRLPTLRGDPGSIPGRKISWIRKWQPTPIFLPGKPHGQRSLADQGPWGHKESDMIEQLNENIPSFLFMVNGINIFKSLKQKTDSGVPPLFSHLHPNPIFFFFFFFRNTFKV